MQNIFVLLLLLERVELKAYEEELEDEGARQLVGRAANERAEGAFFVLRTHVRVCALWAETAGE